MIQTVFNSVTHCLLGIPQALTNSVIYSFLGIGILFIAFALFEVLTPKHNLRKEILENKNMALAVLCGFFILAGSIIIASAIH
jgi:uncharacterized membrane protein YjfL (UPF0719 family)